MSIRGARRVILDWLALPAPRMIYYVLYMALYFMRCKSLLMAISINSY